MKTYTVKTIDPHGYTCDTDGNFVDNIYTWDCGHTHRVLERAVRCIMSLSGTTRSINANIYDNDNNLIDYTEIEYNLTCPA